MRDRGILLSEETSRATDAYPHKLLQTEGARADTGGTGCWSQWR